MKEDSLGEVLVKNDISIPMLYHHLRCEKILKEYSRAELEEYLDSKLYTAAELSELTGYDASTIRKMLKGREFFGKRKGGARLYPGMINRF